LRHRRAVRGANLLSIEQGLSGRGIDGVNRVVLRRDVDNVVNTSADGLVNHDERLCVDLLVERNCLEQSKRFTPNIGWSKRRLL
jgi:hypothetical protein